ncbi:hypothetical protein [Devosia sp. SL43]|uniref:hypothetical protein n=1 Tax=Devosia sp. SL43 TaxID=2806348 RepID=UPI001F24AE60|nr:hypothetical protein [Devosia sp. SL43]UJW85620.1 hypothetical protein IM737_19885 [Devosia sp. SL43]
MIRAVLATIVLTLPLPALADDMFLTIDNQSSQSAHANTYPVGDDGEAIEDNIGGQGDILPGTTVTYPLASTKCELVRVYVVLADQSEMQADVDLCKSQTVVIPD